MTKANRQTVDIGRIIELEKAIDDSKLKNRNDIINLLVSIYLDTCHGEVLKKNLIDEFSTYEFIRSKMGQNLDQQ